MSRGTEVTVTAGHMLNPSGAPALSRFLHEIGQDGITSLTGFDWGAAAGLPMLPRVRVGRVVLRLAQWRLARSRASQTLRVGDEASFGAALAEWRATWRVPRHVYLAHGDNRLLIDLEDQAQAGQLRRELCGQHHNDVVLHEALPGPGDAWLPGPAGSYVSELVIPLIRTAPDQPQRAGPPPRLAPRSPVAVRSDSMGPSSGRTRSLRVRCGN
jgi:hypothetical protein